MRRIKALFIILLIPLFLSASTRDGSGDTSLSALSRSALSSASYYGSFCDIFINAASLPLLRGDRDYQVSYAPSEKYDTSLLGNETLSYMQNLSSELQGTVVSGPVALSAKVSSRLDNRNLKDDGFVYYDIYSTFDIELALAYSFVNHISLGARLGGGNSVARMQKKMTGIVDAVGNAWFSPYERVTGSEHYNANIGSLFYWDNISFAIVLDDILGETTSYFEHLVSNTTFSLAVKGNEYNREGELNYLVPRLSVSFKGIGFSSVDRSISFQTDLTLQLLKDVLIDTGFKYSYVVFADNTNSREYTFTLLGTYSDFSLLFNFAFLDNIKNGFRPSIVFTYST